MSNTSESIRYSEIQRLVQRKITCPCGTALGISYGERVLQIGNVHFLRFQVGNCAICGRRWRWKPTLEIHLEGIPNLTPV